MGNYSTLWIAKDKEKYNEDTDIYQEIKYSIPLFWLALFVKEHIEKCLEEDSYYYHFQAPIEQSITLFQQRINLWETLYQSEHAHQIAIAFLDFLQQFSGYTVTLEVHDIIGMYVDSNSNEAYEETADMIEFINLIQTNPECSLPFKHWLSSPLQHDRFHTVGLGKEILPCSEADA